MILNDRYLIYFSITKRCYLFFLIFILMFFAFLIGFYKQYQILNYTNEIKINGLYAQKDYISQKIAPGTQGKFVISIDEQEKFKLYVKENNHKPSNMYFKINNKTFNNMREVVEYINKKHLKEIEIEWFWKYDGDDTLDTIDGLKSENYLIELYEGEDAIVL